MTTAREPIAVRAWVTRSRFGTSQLEAQAVAWAPKAVRLQLIDEHGHSEQVSIWANAVEQL